MLCNIFNILNINEYLLLYNNFDDDFNNINYNKIVLDDF